MKNEKMAYFITRYFYQNRLLIIIIYHIKARSLGCEHVANVWFENIISTLGFELDVRD